MIIPAQYLDLRRNFYRGHQGRKCNSLILAFKEADPSGIPAVMDYVVRDQEIHYVKQLQRGAIIRIDAEWCRSDFSGRIVWGGELILEGRE